MEIVKTVWLIGIAIVAVLVYYLVVPKLSTTQKPGIIIRSIVFFGMMGYLALDFYSKGKYWYIVVLIAGSIAFGMVLFTAGNKKDN